MARKPLIINVVQIETAEVGSEERERIEIVALAVGRIIARRNLRLVSGFGLVVGSAALSGALEELNRQDAPNFDWSFHLRPFPQLVPSGWEPQEYYQRYREDLVSKRGRAFTYLV
jgi:hypothetical protein